MTVLEPVGKFFKNDKEMLKFAIETLTQRQSDLDELICTEIPTQNRADVASASNGKNLGQHYYSSF